MTWGHTRVRKRHVVGVLRSRERGTAGTQGGGKQGGGDARRRGGGEAGEWAGKRLGEREPESRSSGVRLDACGPGRLRPGRRPSTDDGQRGGWVRRVRPAAGHTAPRDPSARRTNLPQHPPMPGSPCLFTPQRPYEPPADRPGRPRRPAGQRQGRAGKPAGCGSRGAVLVRTPQGRGRGPEPAQGPRTPPGGEGPRRDGISPPGRAASRAARRGHPPRTGCVRRAAP